MSHSKPVKLGDICEFISGGTPSRSVEHYFQGKMPWITGADITSELITTAREYITQEAIDSSATNIIPKGNILLVTRTGVGKVAIAGVDICISQDFTGLLPDRSRVDVGYLFRLLQASESYFKIHQRGATIQGVTRSVVKDLTIPLPLLAEQKRIAAILDQADALRVKRRAALGRLDALVQSVFLEMFGDPVTNPMGWEERQLAEVADIASGVTKGRKFGNKKTVTVPYMRVANVQDGSIYTGDIKDIEVLPEDIKKYQLEKGDILLTEGGDPDKLGRGAVWKGEITPCIHQNHIFRVRLTSQQLVPEYLSALIASSRGKRYFLRAAKQTTGIASINKTQLTAFPALIPKIDLQQKYLQAIEEIAGLRQQTSAQMSYFENLFHSLQQRAFRGEL